MTDVKIYRTPIAATSRAGRRASELEAEGRLVSDIFGPETVIGHEEDGRPYLPSHPGVHISLSHCVDECVLAVSDRPVGVDIETPRPQLAKIARKFLTAAEISRGPHDIDTLLKYWTAKEAVFKCAGIPSLVISEIELSDDFATATARTVKFAIRHITTPGHLLAIATKA